MNDLPPFWIKVKGGLFLALGVASAGMLIALHPTLATTVLLAIAIWSFCRCYYFAFYVIEHYVDPGFRFAGLWSFARYLVRRREPGARPVKVVEPQADAITPPAPPSPASAPPGPAARGRER